MLAVTAGVGQDEPRQGQLLPQSFPAPSPHLSQAIIKSNCSLFSVCRVHQISRSSLCMLESSPHVSGDSQSVSNMSQTVTLHAYMTWSHTCFRPHNKILAQLADYPVHLIVVRQCTADSLHNMFSILQGASTRHGCTICTRHNSTCSSDFEC